MAEALTIDLPADPSATERFGAWLGRHLRAGDVVALCGELGAGKTTLVRGLALGLGVEDPAAVCSPTYLLVIEHPGPLPLLHADAYLPAKLAAFLRDGGLDYLLDGAAVVAVEWGDRVRELLPDNTLWLEIAVRPGARRRLTLRGWPADRMALLAAMPKIGQDD